uniref:Si:dkey-78k11.9 n=1 Tax=Salmo trutta TaxID=8032 RepID=A0A674AT18_SALTR
SSGFYWTHSISANINKAFSQKFLPAVYISVFIIGLVANCLGLKLLFANWKKFGNINVFVLILGVADILYLMTLPFLVIRFCFNLNLYGSIGFLTCISLYRYLSIVHPLRVMGRITGGHSVVITAVVWVLVCILSLPDVYFDKTVPNSSSGTKTCFDTTSDCFTNDYLNYSIAWTVCGFCIPLLIILGCYGHVAVVLSTKTNINQVMKQRCLKLVFLNHIFRNLNLKTRILKREQMCQDWFTGIYIAHQVSRALVCLNSAINPLVYLHSNDALLMLVLWSNYNVVDPSSVLSYHSH